MDRKHRLKFILLLLLNLTLAIYFFHLVGDNLFFAFDFSKLFFNLGLLSLKVLTLFKKLLPLRKYFFLLAHEVFLSFS